MHPTCFESITALFRSINLNAVIGFQLIRAEQTSTPVSLALEQDSNLEALKTSLFTAIDSSEVSTVEYAGRRSFIIVLRRRRAPGATKLILSMTESLVCKFEECLSFWSRGNHTC